MHQPTISYNTDELLSMGFFPGEDNLSVRLHMQDSDGTVAQSAVA